MPSLTERLQALSSAEDFFTFFGVPFDERVLQVNRLHILKRFHQYLNRAGSPPQTADDVGQFRHCRGLLIQAYRDFVVSTPAAEKVFKVFQDAAGTRHVGLASLRNSLAARAAPSAAAKATPGDRTAGA